MTTEVIYENDGEGIMYIHRDVLEGARLVENMRIHNREIDRMWETYVNMSENNAKIFYSMREAREWLGQNELEVKQVKVAVV